MRFSKFPKKKKRKARASLIGSIEDTLERPVKGEWNQPVQSTDTFSQPLTKKEREFAEMLSKAKANPLKPKRKPKIDVLNQVGDFTRKNFESDSQFVGRVCRETTQSVNQQLLKIRFEGDGTKDGKKKKKKPEVSPEDLTSETSNNTKKSRKSQPNIESNTNLNTSKAELNNNQSGMGPTQKYIDLDRDDADFGRRRNKKIRKVHPESETSATRHVAMTEEQVNRIMHAKEVIRFGERADAPPAFKWRKAESTKAGGLDLLLAANHKSMGKSSVKEKMDASERQSIVDAYRWNKKRRAMKLNDNDDDGDMQ